ncbi:MAG: YlbF family regulator [Peptococcaceae bacterium]|nr:YlbF family regulator [Peptococcaceae bacterium]MEE0547176.1 YlbF family regulator [Peptococcaceae bacterium]
MSIYDKAKALADEIAASDELRRVKETELKMLIDLPAREIVETYQQIQMDAINAGISYDELDDEKKAQLTDLENKMQENAVIVEYMNANQELNQMLESVNMIISSALNDNNGGGCSSCSSAGNCGENDCCSSCGH